MHKILENEEYAEFDRFDICEAYYLFEAHHNLGGMLQSRTSNRRRNESTGNQLARIGFRMSPAKGDYEDLEENGKAIYRNLVLRFCKETNMTLDRYFAYPADHDPLMDDMLRWDEND